MSGFIFVSNLQPYSNLFEDPDGKVEMPPSLKVEVWKRPAEFITDRVSYAAPITHYLVLPLPKQII